MVIKKISRNEIEELISKTGFDYDLMIKDYYITLILLLLKDIPGIYFKGGTALQKFFLNYSRMSEDIDFTLTKDIKLVINEIEKKINESKMFKEITKDKDVDQFTRLIVPYNSEIGKGNILIDLNERAKLVLKPENYEIINVYFDNFVFPCLSKDEMIAEKIAATFARNKPRDYYDLYQIIKQKHEINFKLVKKKCSQSNIEFDTNLLFNNAKKIFNKWDKDLIPLLVNEISFHEVMMTLKRHFK